jgi:hypothetical protein
MRTWIVKTTFQDVYLNISVHKSFGLSITNISAFVISLSRSNIFGKPVVIFSKSGNQLCVCTT